MKNPRLHGGICYGIKHLSVHQILQHLTLASPQAILRRKTDSTKRRQVLNFPTITLKEPQIHTISISTKYQVNPTNILEII